MRDRKYELHRDQPHGDYELNAFRQSTDGDSLLSGLDAFLAEIDTINAMIRDIEGNRSIIEGYRDSIAQSVNDREVAEKRRAAADEVIKKTQAAIKEVKGRLKKIEPKRQDSDLPMRKNQFATSTKRFMSAIEKHQKVVQNFENAEKDNMRRQIKITNPTATEDEIENMVEGGGPVFEGQLLQNNQRRYNAQNTREAVLERQREIQALAQSVEELAELFQEMQYMLESQGKLLADIEETTENVTHDLEKGNEHISRGIKSALSTRRSKWICFGICIIILAIIIIVLAVQFAPKGGNSSSNNSTPTPTPSPAPQPSQQ